MRVHHTQIKQAAALGFDVKIDAAAGTVTLVDTKGEHADIVATDIKVALAEALKLRKPAKAPKGIRKVRKVKPVRVARDEDEDGEDEDEGEGDEDGEGDGEEVVVRSVVKPRYKARYAKNPVKNTNSDAFAVAFRDEVTSEDGELDVAALKAVASANGVAINKYLQVKSRGWEGRARMTVGNILRGMVRRGTDVTIGSQVFKAGTPKAKAPRSRKAKAAK